MSQPVRHFLSNIMVPLKYFINSVKFLQIIGTKITLEGFTGFRAGLDVKGNSTGVHSVYTSHRSYQIMFHVSTMLPFSNGKPNTPSGPEIPMPKVKK